MSLNIYDLDQIAGETVKECAIDYYKFEETRNEVLLYLSNKNIEFINGTKYIDSLQQLSTNFCQHVNEGFSEKELVKKISFEFKKKVALILGRDRIISLGDNLRKIVNLESWNPTTLEAIGRNKKRENDVHNVHQDFFNNDEKKELLATYTWIKKQIREKNGEKIDWDAIIESLKNEGFYDIANKFYINK